MAWNRNRYRDVVPKGEREWKPRPSGRSPNDVPPEPIDRYTALRNALRRGDNQAAMKEVARLDIDPDHIRLVQAELESVRAKAHPGMSRVTLFRER